MTHNFGINIAITILVGLAFISPAHGQLRQYNFNRLTTSAGLSDPAVRCITQDKFGYIWISTANGLHRYDSYEIKYIPLRTNDSVEIPESTVRYLFTDHEGNLWVAISKGIYRYEYATGYFTLQNGSKEIVAKKMVQDQKGTIYLATPFGIMVFDKNKGIFFLASSRATGDSKQLLSKGINDLCITRAGNIYLASDTGLLYYQPTNGSVERKILPSLKDQIVENVAVDESGHLWVNYGEMGSWLLKIDSDFSKTTFYPTFTSRNNLADNRISSLYSDQKGRLWITTARSGLAMYDPENDKFNISLNDPLQQNSISGNITTVAYQDPQGIMWVGTEINGINYFNPDKVFFRSIRPSYNQSPTLPDEWCRAVGEDNAGNLWLGTSSGLSKYDLKNNKYTLFQHTTDKDDELPVNSVRSILCDDKWIWIGTASGLNRYNTVNGHMKVFGEKDSLPLSFFWSIIKDYENNIWLGTRNGIFKYNRRANKIENLSQNAQLAAYARNNTLCLFEDSHRRIWFGFYSKGLLMYDPGNKRIRYWSKKNKDIHSLSNDHITSITEDNTGIIWVATLDGLNSYDAKSDLLTQYLHRENGIPERTAALMPDKKNNLWFADSRGLCMLSWTRKSYTYFDISDGLPTLDFNSQAAFKMKNGDLAYPTLKGFVLFNPEQFSKRSGSIAVHISSFKVFEKEYLPSSGVDEIGEIALRHDQNFFTLEMTAINYANAGQNWYAYKLDNFDKDWIYSTARRVNYTNVPGGDYVFHYKTSTDMEHWDVPEKILAIHISVVYYRTFWFRLLAGLIILSAIYWIYRYRIDQKEKLLLLEKKTYSLQKEKALVMYENLKQQLNPHFLFNSLTSLGSLISSNPASAKEFLERMSKIYRYILKSRDTETVQLADEIKLAEIYVQLQRTRFKDGLQLKIDIGDEYFHRKIAPVTLQNLIENAIKHNIIDNSTPLFISISIQDGWLEVKNNLQKKTFVETSNRQGLSSMKSLYFYLTGKQIHIHESKDFFIIKIPLG